MPNEYVLRLEASGEVTPAPTAADDSDTQPETEEVEQ